MKPLRLHNVNNRSRLCDSLQVVQREHQDLSLKRLVEGIPHGVAEREMNQHGPWGLHLSGDCAIERDGDRWNARRFDSSLNQSDGLIAGASGGCQKYRIHAICLEETGHFRTCPVDQRSDMATQDVSHERKMSWCGFSDEPFLLEFS
jgi:hypothetical protein